MGKAASLCCLPLIPLRGMRSSQVEIEVFDGCTRRQAEGLYNLTTLSRALFNDKVKPTSMDVRTIPLQRIAFDDMINKARVTAESKAQIKEMMTLPLIPTKEDSNMGVGDYPHYVTRSIAPKQRQTNAYENTPDPQSDPSDLKTESSMPSRSSRQRISLVIQRITLKGRRSQDTPDGILDCAKSCKDAKVIRKYRCSDEVYGPQKVVRKFDKNEIKSYRGQFVKVSAIVKV